VIPPSPVPFTPYASTAMTRAFFTSVGSLLREPFGRPPLFFGRCSLLNLVLMLLLNSLVSLASSSCRSRSRRPGLRADALDFQFFFLLGR
jgi:hypothetical protein